MSLADYTFWPFAGMSAEEATAAMAEMATATPSTPLSDEERLLVEAIRAGQETMHHGDDFLAHIVQTDRDMIERAVVAAIARWREGLEEEAEE